MPIAIINRIINAELESVYQNKTKMQTKLLLVVVQIVSVILLVEKIESLMVLL